MAYYRQYFEDHSKDQAAMFLNVCYYVTGPMFTSVSLNPWILISTPHSIAATIHLNKTKFMTKVMNYMLQSKFALF